MLKGVFPDHLTHLCPFIIEWKTGICIRLHKPEWRPSAEFAAFTCIHIETRLILTIKKFIKLIKIIKELQNLTSR